MKCPILMYHKVGKAPPGAMVPYHYVTSRRLDNHLRALGRFGFQTIRLTDYPNQTSVRKPVILTFDDGYLNFTELGLPLFKKHAQIATVFVVVGLIGQTNAWDTKLGDQTEPLMSLDDIREALAAGVEIGCHSMTHARLTTLDQNELRSEVADSKAKLESLLEQSVPTFCYPYGAQNDTVREAVRLAGYTHACSVEKGWNDQTTDRYLLKRVNVRSDTSTPVLFWKLWRQNRVEAANA